jgi:2-dehydro-3-deoxyphosphogluconate aldolase/(4S)-4-hydroxy-2-oxoglutarate aldolase
MARFSRLQVLNETLRIGLVPVFFHPDLEVAKQVVAACVKGGAQVVEYTNRGDNAYRVFSDLVLHFAKSDPSVVLGAGSIIDPATAALYISSGANFVVGSALNPEVARVCNRRKVAYIPGCGTASEISAAEELGVEIVKVFPSDPVNGPKFVRAILGPTPWTRAMPTTGVEPTQECIKAWFTAGVAAVGIGTLLVRKEWIEAGNWSAITALTAQVLGWIRAARGAGLIRGIEHVGLYPHGAASARQIVDWYCEVFDFQASEGHDSYFLSVEGTGRIEVMKEGNTDRAHVAIQVADLEAAMAALQARGIEFETPMIAADRKAAYLRQTDPAGNRVHLLWRR